jgi:ABC-2 type transport system ATP-binding protein
MFGFNQARHVACAYRQFSGSKLMELQADALHIKRGGREVLRGINFSVNSGEVYALLGGNGAGKSTTLLSFLGFLKPKQGRALLKQHEAGEHVALVRKSAAYLPETASLYEHLDAYENLDYFLRLAHKVLTRDEVDQTLDRVALSRKARESKLSEYSKGMRQKVAIALAILRDTDILLLDEPTSGLDPASIDEFHRIVRDLADSGKTILMVTHDVYGACQVADRIGLLRDGRLVAEFNEEGQRKIDTESVHKAFSRTINNLETSTAE